MHGRIVNAAQRAVDLLFDASEPIVAWRGAGAMRASTKTPPACGRFRSERGEGGKAMKNGESFGIPLNDTALAVLARQLGKHPDYVFTYRGRPVKWLIRRRHGGRR